MDGLRQARLGGRDRRRGGQCWGVPALVRPSLATGPAVEPQQMTKGTGQLALPMTINLGLLDIHLGAIPSREEARSLCRPQAISITDHAIAFDACYDVFHHDAH